MNFKRTVLAGMPLEAYAARAGKWNFLILKDLGTYSVSYRLRDKEAANVEGGVSASSTIMAPFEDFAEASAAAEAKLAELKRMA